MDSAIIIFVRHPELGKVKTRLAATIGNETALKVYKFLLRHTYELIKDGPVPVYVFYADKIVADDIWIGDNIIKKVQTGTDLGEKMKNAFIEVFAKGYSKVVIIGSDCYELSAELIDEAMKKLNNYDVIVGPAKDGGYYLLGMHSPFKNLFENIEWSTNKVFSKTIEVIKLANCSFFTLPVLGDVDTEEDITFSY